MGGRGWGRGWGHLFLSRFNFYFPAKLEVVDLLKWTRGFVYLTSANRFMWVGTGRGQGGTGWGQGQGQTGSGRGLWTWVPQACSGWGRGRAMLVLALLWTQIRRRCRFIFLALSFHPDVLWENPSWLLSSWLSRCFFLFYLVMSKLDLKRQKLTPEANEGPPEGEFWRDFCFISFTCDLSFSSCVLHSLSLLFQLLFW